jgi:hypothetical protein
MGLFGAQMRRQVTLPPIRQRLLVPLGVCLCPQDLSVALMSNALALASAHKHYSSRAPLWLPELEAACHNDDIVLTESNGVEDKHPPRLYSTAVARKLFALSLAILGSNKGTTHACIAKVLLDTIPVPT